MLNVKGWRHTLPVAFIWEWENLTMMRFLHPRALVSRESRLSVGMLCRCGLLACGLAFCSRPIQANELSMDEAIAKALHQQPALAGLEKAALAAREAAVARAQLPDPQVRLGVQNLAVTGDNRFDLAGDDMTMTTIGFMQKMVRPDKRESAASRKRAEAEQWKAEEAALARRIRRDVALTWIDLFLAIRQQTLLDAKRRELRAEQTVFKQQMAADQASAQQIFALQTMAAFMDDQHLKAQGMERVARSALARWTGEASKQPLPPSLPPVTPPPPLSALQEKLALHPVALASKANELAAGHEVKSARVAAQPDWSWELMYGVRMEDRADMVTFQISIDLPWDQDKRQNRRLAEKLALAEQARYSSRDVLRQLESELLEAWSAWEIADSRTRHYADILLPAAKARVETARAGYSAARQPLSPIWEARRNLLDMQLEALDARVAKAKAQARLTYFIEEIEENEHATE